MSFQYDHSANFGVRRRKLQPKRKRKTLLQYLREVQTEREEKGKRAN